MAAWTFLFITPGVMVTALGDAAPGAFSVPWQGDPVPPCPGKLNATTAPTAERDVAEEQTLDLHPMRDA